MVCQGSLGLRGRGAIISPTLRKRIGLGNYAPDVGPAKITRGICTISAIANGGEGYTHHADSSIVLLPRSSARLMSAEREG